MTLEHNLHSSPSAFNNPESSLLNLSTSQDSESGNGTHETYHRIEVGKREDMILEIERLNSEKQVTN